MGRDGHEGYGCTVEGCRGVVGPSIPVPSQPDFWVRVREDGSWACSDVPPVFPTERAGRRAYRCATCSKTFRIVDSEVREQRLDASL